MLRKRYDIIRNQLEEHLSGINENTAEIQALFDYLQEMDSKIERITARLDTIQLSQEKPAIMPLTQLEKKVFLILYTEQVPMNFKELAAKITAPCEVVQECISSLSQKGIPLARSFIQNQLFFSLEENFKERQAKENLVNLSLNSFIN